MKREKKPWKIALSYLLSFALLFTFIPTFSTVKAEGTGNTYYLSASGSDSNPGTEASPFATINYAYSRLASGDTLIIRGGTYRGFLQVISKSDVTIKNYGQEKVVIQDGTNGVGYLGYIGQSSRVTVSGIEFAFTDAGVEGNSMYIDNSQNVRITNCEFFRGEGGIIVRTGTTGLEVSGCVMHGFTWPYGAILLYTASGGNIYNNVFYDSCFGVNTYGGTTSGNKVYNNTFYNCTNDIGGANIGGIPHDNIFRNNIFSSAVQNQDHDYADWIDDFMKLNSFDYDCYNSVTMPSGTVTNDGKTLAAMQSAGVETHGFSGDPKFLNAVTDELRTGRGSSCIGTGTAALAPSADILGNTQASPPDVGAYVHADSVYYYVAANGDDANAGTDAQPFKSVAHALGVMQSGDSVFLKGGTYTDGIAVSGKDNITVANYPSGQPVVGQLVNIQNSRNVTVKGLSVNSTVEIGNSADIKLDGLNVNNGQIVVVPGSGTCTDGFEISGCVINGYQGEGAILIYNGKNGNIVNNVIENNKSQGILFEGGQCVNNNVFNNTLYHNGSDVLLVYAPSLGNPGSNVFKNNIFTGQIVLGNENFYSTNTFDSNCYDQSALTDGIGYYNVYDGSGNYSSTAYPTLADIQAKNQEQHGFLGNPAFLNPAVGDLRLSKTSDCIGRGTSDGAPAYDIKGLARSVPYDIGAYKFNNDVVDYYVSPDGDDAGAGSVEAPFKTIQHAVDVMTPGETVYVESGTYDQSVAISGKQGSASDYYSIKAVKDAAVVLSSNNTKDTAISIDGASRFWKIDGIGIQNYTGNGIEIKGGSGNIQLSNLSISHVGGSGVSGDHSSDCSLENVKIYNMKYGVALSGSAGWTIDRVCADSASESALSSDAGSGIRVTGSLFLNSRFGMNIAGSGNFVVYNNDFYGNSESDLKLGQNSTGGAVKNNIFGSSDSAYALEIADAASLDNDLDDNCYNKVTGPAVNDTSALTFDQFRSLGKEAGGMAADPMFTDPADGNFLLKPYSPCAAKGVRDSNAPAVGYDGASFGDPMDIGAVFSPYSLKTYYVAADGDDSGDGSFSHPWKTIAKGMSTMKQSDTLYIRGGTYNERVDLSDKNGRSYTPFTVKNYPGETVVMDTQGKQDVGIKFSGCSYWVLDGLKFTNYTGAAVWTASGSKYITMKNLEIWNIDNPVPHTSGTEGILGDGGDYCTVKNCYIHDIGLTLMANLDHGAYIGYGSKGWTFDSNRIDKVAASGIQFYGKPSGGEDCTVTNNIISNCRYGLILTMGKNNLISNNTFYNNHEDDLYMDWWYTGSVIQNNIFYNDLAAGTKVLEENTSTGKAEPVEISPQPIAIFCSDVSSNVFRNNVICNKHFGNRVYDINKAVSLDVYLKTQTLNTFEGNIEKDPLLADPAKNDFSLKICSPCIDAGVADKVPAADFAGQTRDSRPDIGALEYAVAAPVITPSTTKTTDQYVRVTIRAAGNTAIRYSLDNGKTWRRYTGPFKVYRNGTVLAKATDLLGRTSADAALVIGNIDKSPAVKSVQVLPSAVMVPRGGSFRFFAAVRGTNHPDRKVIWSVSGNRSGATSIDKDGNLTVGADETAKTLTVTAVSAADAGKTGTAAVKVLSFRFFPPFPVGFWPFS